MLLFLFYHVKLSWYVDILLCKMYILYPYSPWNCVNYEEDPWTEAERRYDLPYYTHARRASFLFDLCSIWTGFLCVYFWYFFVPVSVFINDLDERRVASVQEVKIYAILNKYSYLLFYIKSWE